MNNLLLTVCLLLATMTLMAADESAAPTPPAGDSPQTILAPSAEPGFLEKHPVRLLNDKGKVTVQTQAEPVVRVASEPEGRHAGLIIPVPKSDALATAKTVHIRFRLVSPEKVRAAQFVLSARLVKEWAKHAPPPQPKKTLAAGQWHVLSYDVSGWDKASMQYLRLYHATQEPVQPTTFELAQVWWE